MRKLIILLSLLLASAITATAVELAINPQSLTAAKGQTFTVGVNITTDVNVTSSQLSISYNPQMLEAKSYMNGGFLSKDGLSLIDADSFINNTIGLVEVYYIRNMSAPMTGITGQGVLANITFKPLIKHGLAQINISDFELTNLSNNSIVATSSHGLVNIETRENVVINEFSSGSSYDDWVEIYNNDTNAINLSGWKISDSEAHSKNISNIILGVSGLSTIDMGSYLNKGSDTINLLDDENFIVDSYIYSLDMGEGNSSGRMHNGLSNWVIFTQPTPNSSNNRLPVGTIADKPATEDVANHFDLTEITDLDGDALAFTVVGEDLSHVNCGLLNQTNVTITPALNWNGIASCTIEASDGIGKVNKTFNINVSSVNDGPGISAIAPLDAIEDELYVLNATPYLSDVDNNISELSITQNSTYAAVSGQTITFNYSNGVLSEVVTIIVSDGALTASQNISVNIAPVNDAPVISSIAPLNPIEDELYFLNMTPLVSDVDTNMSGLSITENSTYATVNGQIITFNYPNNVLSESVLITVTDGLLSANRTVAVAVTVVNDAPVLSAVPQINFLEGQYYDLNLNSYVSDQDNTKDQIAWSTSGNTNLNVAFDNLIMNVSADQTWHGSETFLLKAFDGGLYANKTVNANVQSIISFSDLIITIDGQPYPAVNGATVGPASPDSKISFSVKLSNNYPATQQWVEGITLNAKLDSTIDDEQQTSVPFTLDGAKSTTKSLSFDNLPLTIYEGKYNLTLTATGMDHKGVQREVSWLVFIDYQTQNREVRIAGAKLADKELRCFRETTLNTTLVNTGETRQYVNLTAKNPQIQFYQSQILSIEPKETTSIVDALSIPAILAPGSYPIAVSISYDDGQGGYISQSTQADLKIGTCVAVPDQRVNEDNTTAISINLFDYTNDTIKDDSFFTYAIESQSNQQLISCSFATQTITCQAPAHDAMGISEIIVSANSGVYSNFDSFRVTVDGVNDAPTAYNANIETGEDSNVSINLNCTDPDDTSVSYVLITQPTHGAIYGAGSQRLYLPSANYNGADSFTYKCNDGKADSNTATVSINVRSVLDRPSIKSSYPTGSLLSVADNIDQIFNISIEDPDSINPPIIWYLNESRIPTTGNSYVFNAPAGIYKVKVNLTNAAENESFGEKTWTITASLLPITTYEGTIRNVNPTNVGSFTNLTIIRPTVGMIDFGDRAINLADAVNIDANVKIENGVVGIKTDEYGFSVFGVPAKVTLYNLGHESTPRIYYNNGFETTGTSECTANTNPSCTNVNYNLTTKTLSFDVSHFTTFFLPAVNRAPRISSEAPKTAVLGEEYRYSIAASDPENDLLTYILHVKPAGMSISGNVITWTASNATLANVSLVVSDGTNIATQDWTINVKEGSKLRIDKVKAIIGEEKDNDISNGEDISKSAKPGDKVKFDVKLRNAYSHSSNIDIEDITVAIKIRDIDDGDDIEVEADLDELEADDTDTVTLEFTIPKIVDEGKYDVIIDADGDVNGKDMDDRWEINLEVEKDKHQIKIDDASLSPNTVRCARNPSLSVDIANTGREDEDSVSISVLNTELGIDEEETDIELDEEGSDSTATRTFSLDVPEDAEEGTYQISIKTYYDEKLSDSRTLNLWVYDCEESEVKTPVKTEPVEVVKIPEPVKQKQTPVTTISFRDSSWYMTLLVSLFIILLGGIVFLIGAVIIKR